MNSAITNIAYNVLRDLTREYFPEHLIFFEDYWAELLLGMKGVRPQDLKGAANYLSPSKLGIVFESFGDINHAIWKFLTFGIDEEGKIDFSQFRKHIAQKIRERNLPLSKERIEAALNSAATLLEIYCSILDLKELRRQNILEMRQLSGSDFMDFEDFKFRVGTSEDGKRYAACPDKTFYIEERLFVRIAMLAAARKYRGEGWVSKADELRFSDKGQDLNKLRRLARNILKSDLAGTDIIRAGGRGLIRLDIDPECIEIDESICRYEHPERRFIENRIRNVFSDWNALEARYREGQRKAPAEGITPILTKYHINSPRTFYLELKQLLDYTSIVQDTVENIMGKEFHDEAWKKEWEKLKIKMEKLMDVTLPLIDE